RGYLTPSPLGGKGQEGRPQRRQGTLGRRAAEGGERSLVGLFWPDGEKAEIIGTQGLALICAERSRKRGDLGSTPVVRMRLCRELFAGERVGRTRGYT